MHKDRADRVHETTGIAFIFAGELPFGNAELGARGPFNDVEVWRCSRCHALVVEGESDAAHAEGHRRADTLATLLGETRVELDELRERLAHGAFKPLDGGAPTQASMPAADMRRGAARVTAWRDSANVREVPPS